MQNEADVGDEMRELQDRLEVENKIRDGAENLLRVLSGEESLRRQVEKELSEANDRIARIESAIASRTTQPSESRNANIFEDAWLAQSNDQSQGSALDELEAIQTESNDIPTQLLHLQHFNRILEKAPQAAWSLPIEKILEALIPLLGDEADKSIRSTAHKAVRLCCVDASIAQELNASMLASYLSRSLTRDHRFHLEKQQALLTVRHLLQLTHTSGVALVSVGLIRIVVSIAESNEDRLRSASLETLVELGEGHQSLHDYASCLSPMLFCIVIRDIELLAAAEGIRVLLQVLADGPHELAPSIMTAFLYLLDRPHLRSFIRPDVDLEIAVAGLTDFVAADLSPDSAARHRAAEEKIRSSGRLISLMMRSWSGLLFLATGEQRAIRALVGSLASPSTFVKEVVMDTLFEIFRIRTPDWFNPFVAGKRLTLYRHPRASQETPPSSDSIGAGYSRLAGRPNLIEHYVGMLLIVFVNVGLLEELVTLTENRSTQLSRRAALLLGELLQLAAKLLPVSYNIQIQALPKLFGCAASFNDFGARMTASAALAGIDSINHNRMRLLTSSTSSSKATRYDGVDDSAVMNSATIRLQVESSKIRARYFIDDLTFRNQILESGVLNNTVTASVQSNATWNVDVIIELVEGALLNPRRLEEVMKGTKWLRRVITFFYPAERKYADLPRTAAYMKYCRLGLSLISTLLSTPEGVRFLNEDKLLKQIADALTALDPMAVSAIAGMDSIFSKSRIKDTMSGTYIDFIAQFTKCDEGHKMLEKFKVYTTLYHLTDLQSREDITIGVVQKSAYHFEGHTRILLSKVLTSNYPVHRFLATQFLDTLIENIDTFDSTHEWIVALLVTQIYDPSAVVRELAIKITEKACQESQGVLEALIALRPQLEHLGYGGATLLFRFLSSDVGISYLNEIGYVERGLYEWFSERNDSYVVQLELQLFRALSTLDTSQKISDSIAGALPLHFYGELVKTQEGRQILDNSGHFKSFAAFIREFGLEDQNLEVIQRLKSVLWAIGNIGATEGGLPFLDSEGIIPNIMEIAEDSLCLTIRGTCIFCLGLISYTEAGSEILEELGWSTRSSTQGLTTGVAVPGDISRLFWCPYIAREATQSARTLTPAVNVIERQIIKAVENLANHLMANAASRSLVRLKSQYSSAFLSEATQFRVLHMLNNTHFRLPVRRYLLDLFEITFTVEALGAINQAGIRMAETDDFAPIPLEKYATPSKRSRSGLNWPSGQSDMMDDTTSLFSDSDSLANVTAEGTDSKIMVLDPVVLIKGFIRC